MTAANRRCPASCHRPARCIRRTWTASNKTKTRDRLALTIRDELPDRVGASRYVPRGTRQHVVQLMLEHRSFDHILGFLYADSGNVSPTGVAFEGLIGKESNPDTNGNPVQLFKINTAEPGVYFMPGADPGEGYANTNSQLFGSGTAPALVATNQGCVTNFDATIAWDQRVGRTVQPGATAEAQAHYTEPWTDLYLSEDLCED
jgi:phospholipase C